MFNRKLFKKFAATAVSVAMVMSLASCGGNQSGSNADEFVIGGIGPTTGAVATYGEAVRNGAQLAVDEVNAAGGINGVKVRFEWQDDEHDAEKSINAYNTLKDKGMHALMGTTTSGPCTAVVAKTAEDNMFHLTPSGSAVDCIKGDHAFRVCFSDPNLGVASAEYFSTHFADKKVAVLYNTSDVYSSGVYEKFAAEAAKRGINVVETQAFTKDSATDFSVQLQKIKNSGADMVYLPIYYQDAAIVLTQADKMGLKVDWFGCDGLDGVIPQLGDHAALAEGVMLLTPYIANSSESKSETFTKSYKDTFDGLVPTQFAADAYDAIYVLKAAMEEAGVTPDMAPSDICEALKPAMLKIKVDGVTGTMTWTADGEPHKEPKAMVIRNSEYEAME